MPHENTIVVDPLGRLVALSPALHLDEGPPAPTAVGDAVRTVIEAPACLIEIPARHLYYFRSFGWNFTLLVEVWYQEEAWTAVRCQKNPSPALVQELLARGTFIAGRCLD